ncbi:23S rRNA (uracil(1939)-C(5))-methyltransferase RlmD [Trichloromonas sp.]|uniref:23S rRNA (uracil(1939)-C(5))-methyltransferase RlmD n=1 Tax=Trichloromonas sp. TaxID=3069249 RepID=UPI002A425DFC|nr:23S rRNA (uracil(1939)-C(5))-methyltransferase RlmD [Trichloromonas sp.]
MAKPPVKPVKSQKTKRRAPAPSIELDINRLDDEGMGIGYYQTKEVLIAGALPGEKVTFAIEYEGQRRIIGRLRKVLRRSVDRGVPVCKRAEDCQGCSLIAMNYPAQLRFKEAKVRRYLGNRAPLAEVPVLPIWEAGQRLGYRTNAKLVMAKERGEVKIGLYRRGSHTVVDISDCPLHHPLINRIVAVVKEEIARQDIYLYNPRSKRGLLRYLTIKVAPAVNRAMVTFVCTERNFRELTHLGKWLMKKVPEVVSVQQNINSAEGNVIFGRETLKMLGVPDLIDQVGEIRLRIAPTSFFQVHNEQAARIYAQVRQWAGLNPGETAVDLYCGIGGIALNLARDAGRVIGIEVSEEAVRNARENARMNERNNCTFIAGDAAELIHDLAGDVPPGSVAVLNPPRGGCAEEVLTELTGLAPRTIIYVSCNPETLARDLELLHRLSYGTEAVQPVDMFPQTPHVESIARLSPLPKRR